MSIDPRTALRRREVAEQQIRTSIRWCLAILAVLLLAGVIIWFLGFSPQLSLQTIEVEGVERGAIEEILTAENIVEGRPLLAIQTGAVKERLEEDPWISVATVDRVFPHSLEVRVRERRALAWIWLDGRWGLLSDDGVVVEYAESPVPIRSSIRISVDDPGVGLSVDDDHVFGALRFVDALPDELARRTVASVIQNELWMLVGYRMVRLGRPVHIEQKAASFLAILDNVPEGVIDITAPNRPAIRPPDGTGGGPFPTLDTPLAPNTNDSYPFANLEV